MFDNCIGHTGNGKWEFVVSELLLAFTQIVGVKRCGRKEAKRAVKGQARGISVAEPRISFELGKGRPEMLGMTPRQFSRKERRDE